MWSKNHQNTILVSHSLASLWGLLCRLNIEIHPTLELWLWYLSGVAPWSCRFYEGTEIATLLPENLRMTPKIGSKEEHPPGPGLTRLSQAFMEHLQETSIISISEDKNHRFSGEDFRLDQSWPIHWYGSGSAMPFLDCLTPTAIAAVGGTTPPVMAGDNFPLLNTPRKNAEFHQGCRDFCEISQHFRTRRFIMAGLFQPGVFANQKAVKHGVKHGKTRKSTRLDVGGVFFSSPIYTQLIGFSQWVSISVDDFPVELEELIFLNLPCYITRYYKGQLEIVAKNQVDFLHIFLLWSSFCYYDSWPWALNLNVWDGKPQGHSLAHRYWPAWTPLLSWRVPSRLFGHHLTSLMTSGNST